MPPAKRGASLGSHLVQTVPLFNVCVWKESVVGFN